MRIFRLGRVRLKSFPRLSVPHERHDRLDVGIGETLDDRHGSERPVMGSHPPPNSEEKRPVCMMVRFIDLRKVRRAPLGSS